MADQNKKDDKKAGLPALNLRSAGAYGGASSYAAGGSSGALGGLLSLGTTAGKVAVVLVLTALGGGAYGVAHFLAPSHAGAGSHFWQVGAPRPANSPALSTQPSAPQAASDASGLGMVTGSLDGRTPAERAAADAAKAAAAQQAANDANAAANATPAPAAGSLTAQAGGPKASPFAQKFGALSTGGGSGQAIGGALNGGSGLAGGVGLGFDRPLSAPKNLSASRGKPGAQQAIMGRARAGSHGRGFAYKQLMHSSGLSRQAAGTSGETSSALASQAFTGAPAVAGSPITGGGASGATTGGGATNQGGPINSGPTLSQQAPTQAPPDAPHSDSTPWGPQAKLATLLLTIAGVALLAAHLLAMFAKKYPGIGSWAFPLAKFLAVTAAGLGAAAAALGLILMKQGQMMYGAIFTGGGALISILAVKALLDDSLDPDKAVQQAGQAATDKAATAAGQGTSGAAPGNGIQIGNLPPNSTVDLHIVTGPSVAPTVAPTAPVVPPTTTIPQSGVIPVGPNGPPPPPQSFNI